MQKKKKKNRRRKSFLMFNAGKIWLKKTKKKQQCKNYEYFLT